MKVKIVNVGRHSLIYGFGMVLSKAVSFMMLPVYTRYLTPADYGTAELLSITIDIVAMTVGIGINSTIFKYYSEYEKPEDKKEVISTAAIMNLTIAFVTSIVGVIFSDEISKYIFGYTGHSFFFRLTFIIYFIQQGIVIVPLMYIRALQTPKLFVLIGAIKLMIQVSLNSFFLVVLNMGIAGVLYSTLLAEMAIGLYLSFYIVRSVGFRFSLSKSKKMVRFGYPFVFISLSSFILTFSDRYFLNVYSNLETIGIYAIAYKFGFLMSYLAFDPFLQIWEPQRFEIAKQDDAMIIFKKVFLYLNIVMISFSLLLVLFAKDVLMFMVDTAYREAYRLVPIVIVAYIVQSWTYYCDFGLHHSGRSNYIALSSVLAVIGVTALNFLLIPVYGAYGAAWATVLAFFLRFVLVYVFSQKCYFIDYGWSKLVILLTVSLCIYLFNCSLAISYLSLSLCVNAGLIVLFGVIVYRFFLEEEEREFIRQVLKRPILMPSVLPKTKM